MKSSREKVGSDEARPTALFTNLPKKVVIDSSDDYSCSETAEKVSENEF